MVARQTGLAGRKYKSSSLQPITATQQENFRCNTSFNSIRNLYKLNGIAAVALPASKYDLDENLNGKLKRRARLAVPIAHGT
jgi:hypothetical protein